MGFVNKVMLLGNTTRDPQVRQLPSGSPVCDFGLATNRVFKTTAGEERQETLFVECTAFGRLAEVIAEYCPKGRSIFVEGRLHYETWEDNKQGTPVRRSKLSVIVENFQFVGGRSLEGEEPQRALPMGGRSEKPAEAAANEMPARRGNDRPMRDGQSAPAGTAIARTALKKKGKMRVAADAKNDDQAIDQMATETERLEEADLPF